MCCQIRFPPSNSYSYYPNYPQGCRNRKQLSKFPRNVASFNAQSQELTAEGSNCSTHTAEGKYLFHTQRKLFRRTHTRQDQPLVPCSINLYITLGLRAIVAPAMSTTSNSVGSEHDALVSSSECETIWYIAKWSKKGNSSRMQLRHLGGIGSASSQPHSYPSELCNMSSTDGLFICLLAFEPIHTVGDWHVQLTGPSRRNHCAHIHCIRTSRNHNIIICTNQHIQRVTSKKSSSVEHQMFYHREERNSPTQRKKTRTGLRKSSASYKDLGCVSRGCHA